MININKRKLVVVAIIAVAATLVYFILRNEPNVSLEVAPSVADITLDGSKKIKQGNIYLNPGNHRLNVTMEGFADKLVNFTAESGKLTRVAVVLVPNSPAGAQWLRDHPKEQLRRESLGGEVFDNTVSGAVEQLPLINELPHIDQLYRIDYGKSRQFPDDPSKSAIYITYYSDQGKKQAAEWLQFKGYGVKDLEIIYQKGR